MVAKDLGVDVAEVYRMESRLSGADIAFDTPADFDEGDAIYTPNLLEDHSGDPAQLVESANSSQVKREELYLALNELEGRSKDILMKRWLLEPKATLNSLASEYGVSAERIRQLEKLAIEKVRRTILALN